MSNDISKLRGILFDALAAIKAGHMDMDQARAINDLSKTLVDSARVEVQYIQATGGEAGSSFLAPALPGEVPANGITGIVRHRLGG